MKSVCDVKQDNLRNVLWAGSLMNRYPAIALLMLGHILAASLADGLFLPCSASSSKSNNAAATEPPGLSTKLIKINSSAQFLELRSEHDPFARVCDYTFGLERLEVTDAYPMSESASGDLWYKISSKSIASERDAWLRFDGGKMVRSKEVYADLRKAFQEPDPNGRLVVYTQLGDSCSVEFAIPSMPPGPGWLARVAENRLYGFIFALTVIAGAIWFAWFDRPAPMRGERYRDEARSARHGRSAWLNYLEALMNPNAPHAAPAGRTTSRGSQPQHISEDAAMDLKAKLQESREALSEIKESLESASIALHVNDNWSWDIDELGRWCGDIDECEFAPGNTKSIEATLQYLLKNMDYSSRYLSLLMEGFSQVMRKVLPPQVAQSAEERRSRPGTNRRQDSFLRPLSYNETLISIKESLAHCLQPKPQDLSVPAADTASLLSQTRTASEAIAETVRQLRKENEGLALQANEQKDALSILSSELTMYKKNVLLLKQRPRAEDTAIVRGACEGILASVDRILVTLYSFHSVDPTFGNALSKILERMRHFKVHDYFVWMEAVQAMREGEAIALTSPKVQRFVHANGKEDIRAFLDGVKQAIFEDCVFNNLDDILIGLEELKRLHWKLELTNDDARNFPRLTDQLMQLQGVLLTSLGTIGCYPIPLEIGASAKELMARSHATQIGEINGSCSYPLKGTWQTYDLVEINNWAYLNESGKLLGNSKAQIKTHLPG